MVFRKAAQHAALHVFAFHPEHDHTIEDGEQQADDEHHQKPSDEYPAQ
jgi:hypothetical protein